jgi:hypothetical protein
VLGAFESERELTSLSCLAARALGSSRSINQVAIYTTCFLLGSLGRRLPSARAPLTPAKRRLWRRSHAAAHQSSCNNALYTPRAPLKQITTSLSACQPRSELARRCSLDHESATHLCCFPNLLNSHHALLDSKSWARFTPSSSPHELAGVMKGESVLESRNLEATLAMVVSVTSLLLLNRTVSEGGWSGSEDGCSVAPVKRGRGSTPSTESICRSWRGDTPLRARASSYTER